MSKEFCTECGAEITSNTGFCQECGATTKSLEKQVAKNQEEFSKQQHINKIKKYFIKGDKDYKLAIFYSILIPFLGNFYLKEDLKNLALSGFSILIIMSYIICMFIITDFTYSVLHSQFLIILILLWIISICYLFFQIWKYEQNKEEFINNADDYSNIGTYYNIAENKFLKFLPVILIILCIFAYGVSTMDTSDKIYECETFTIEYPNEYYVTTFHDSDDNDKISFYNKDSNIDDYGEILVPKYGDSIQGLKTNWGYSNIDYSKDWEDTKFLGMPALKVKGSDHISMFEHDGKIYSIYYSGPESKKILESIKFKEK